MAKELILIDSCVLINASRKDPKAKTDLMEIMNHTAYSVITHLELLFGANTLTKKDAINKIFEAYYGIPLFGTRLLDCGYLISYGLSFIDI